MPTVPNIYTPPNSVVASSITTPQICLLIHGRPASGKTWSALTFPNPVVADFDNGNTSIKQRAPSAVIMPFFDDVWAKKITGAGSVKDAFKLWLNTEARKLTNEQTLIVDSLSSWQDTFHATQESYAKLMATQTKSGEPDERGHVWGEKLKYFRDCHIIFRALKCHVVLICHDSETRDDKTGMLVTKIKPSMTGSFADSLGRFYTDIFHQEVLEKKDPAGKLVGVDYVWRTRGDARFDLKTRMINCEPVVPADFKSFKY